MDTKPHIGNEESTTGSETDTATVADGDGESGTEDGSMFANATGTGLIDQDTDHTEPSGPVPARASGRKSDQGRRMDAKEESDAGSGTAKAALAALEASKKERAKATVERNEAAGDKITSRFNIFKRKREKIRGKTADPTMLPCIMSILGRKFVGVLWEAFIAIVILLYFFMVTYQLSFATTGSIKQINTVFDVAEYIFLLDLAFRLLVESWRHAREEDSTFFFIPFSVKFWIFHMASLFPYEYLFIGITGVLNADSISQLTVHDYCHFGRFLLGIRIWVFYNNLEHERVLSEFVVFLLKFFTFYFVLIHLFACILVWTTAASSFDHLLGRSVSRLDNTWMGYAYATRPDFVSTPLDNYLLSVVFSITMLTSVGYGNPAARNEIEMLVCVAFMLVGAIGLAGIFGSFLTSFLLEQDGSRFDLFYRLEAIRNVLKSLGSTDVFAATVTEYYNCLWNFREGVYHVPLINHLPQSFHRDIVYDICTEMFNKSVLFRGLEEPFLRAVSRVVELVLYNPDMIILQQGDYGMTMYYIIQGECLVKSKHNTNIVTAILRPGCIFGESNLFLSYPNVCNIETRTTCQLLRLSKEHLMEVFNDHIYILGFMRTRIQERMRDLRVYYEKKGKHPITWVQLKSKYDPSSWVIYTQYDIVFRWAHGCNSLVDEDVVDDTEATVIVDMPCPAGTQPKDKMIAYKTCVIPPTLISTSARVHTWHICVMILASIFCFVGPFNVSFQKTSEMSYYLRQIFSPLETFMTAVFLADIFVEIMTACPVSGVYYKFWDGLRVKASTFPFYLDILAALPIHLILLHNMEALPRSLIIIMSMGFKCTKMWKVTRYFTYLGNVYYDNIFWYRVMQASTMVFVCVHWMACVSFAMACTPPEFLDPHQNRQCKTTSWLSTLYVEDILEDHIPDPEHDVSPNSLANRMPYLVSMYYAISTFSTSGYGDFFPRTKLEMVVTVFYVTLGFYLTGYFTGLLTSALACTVRPNVSFQQTLVSIRQFLRIHGLSGTLRDRIIEHYSLRYQYNEGVILPRNVNDLMYDAPPYLQDDCLFATLQLHLTGIPIFDHVHPNLIIQMAKMMERYVVPPNIYFLRRGDVRRQMYIIYKGSVAFLKEETDEIKLILEPTGHFGQRDLLFGEPSHNNIKTLSYCVIYAIDLQSFNKVFVRDFELQAAVRIKKDEYAEHIRDLNNLYASVGKLHHAQERKPTKIPSWIVFQKRGAIYSEPFNDYCDCEDFRKPYEGKWGSFLKLVLMNRTIHPAGTFALCWMLLLAVMTMVIIIKEFLQVGVFLWRPEVDTLGTAINIVFYMDMYVGMHWGYYTTANHLVCHPVKTATHYILDGALVYAFFIEFAPYPLIAVLLKTVNFQFHGDGRLWSAKISLYGKVVRVFRVPIIIRFCHRVFVARTIVLTSLYVLLTVFICSCVANYAIQLACPWYANSWKDGDEYRLPACLSGSWITLKLPPNHIKEFTARWIVAMYYVCQQTFLVGYGDMTTIRMDESEIFLSLGLMLFGFIVMRVIISDITAAAVDSDEIRAAYAEQIERLGTVLYREKVHPKLIRATMTHMKHTWELSKGLEPQELLGALHPALQSDLFSEYIGDAVSRVPIFSGVRDNVLRTICTYMKKQYFKRGERIMRRGNLEYEMYIIVDGDVWIAEKNLELKCSLGPGECMGETQMIYGLQRRYSAIAANNVEVFALNSDGFSEILDRYPNLLEDMEIKLGHKKLDLFERKISLIQDSLSDLEVEKRTHFDVVVLRNSAIIRDVVYAREVPGFGEEDDEAVIESRNIIISFLTRHVLSWGTENHGLPFFYFASRGVMKRFSLLLHPKCGFQLKLKFMVLGVAFLSPALSIFHILCAPKVYEKQYIITMDIIAGVFETTYVVYIITRFITPFPTVGGEFCTDHKKIACRYFLNLSRFATDLVSSIPVELIPQSMTYTPYRYLNLLRVLRLIHYYRSHNDRLGSITETAFRYNLVMSCSSFVLMAHFLACLFYRISECDIRNLPANVKIEGYMACPNGTWTANYVDEILVGSASKKSNLLNYWWYIRALYWVICTVTTTGFGDIVPHTMPEIGFAIFVIFCGAFVMSIILSLFTSGLASNAKFYREYTYQVKLLVQYLGTIGLSKERQEQVQIWYNSCWDICRGSSYKKTTQVLPLSLQIEVNLAIYYETIKMVPLFKGMEKRFLRQVAHRLIHHVHLAGSDIRNEGDQGGTLYIVAKGRVAGYLINKNGQAKLVRWYNRGSCFGRLSTLFYEQTCTKSYRAEDQSEILYLRQKDIYQLAQNFPKFSLKLQEYIESSYNPVLGTSTILNVAKRKRHRIAIQVRLPANRNQGTSTIDHHKRDKPANKNPPKARGGRKQTRRRKLLVPTSQQREEEAKIQKHVQELLDAHVKLRMGEDIPEVGSKDGESVEMKRKAKKQQSKKRKPRSKGRRK